MTKTNIIAKTLIAGLACVALCGTTLAAPHGGGQQPRKTPTHQKAPAPRGGHARAPAPHGVPVTHHAPAPAQHRHTPPPPPPPPQPAHHHGGHQCGPGWVTLGAAAIGGIIGGIAGACR